jgi:PadR family transcriptional regulator PadR
MAGQRHRWRWGQSRRAVRMLEPALLLLLHRGPAHGYTLLEQLADFGLEDRHPSIVYRTLNEMQGQGWLSSSWDEQETQGPPRRVYHLTALGNEVLAGWAGDLEGMRAQVDHLLSAYRQHMEKGEGEYH